MGTKKSKKKLTRRTSKKATSTKPVTFYSKTLTMDEAGDYSYEEKNLAVWVQSDGAGGWSGVVRVETKTFGIVEFDLWPKIYKKPQKAADALAEFVDEFSKNLVKLISPPPRKKG